MQPHSRQTRLATERARQEKWGEGKEHVPQPPLLLLLQLLFLMRELALLAEQLNREEVLVRSQV
jgi:hypothetical protein